MLVNTNQKYVNYLVRINEAIVEKLMTDNQIDELEASDLYYQSKTFAQLSDERTGLYKRSWQEVYEMLKNEIP
jgi:hypothetical protein